MRCTQLVLLAALVVAVHEALGLVALEGDARLPGGADDETLVGVEERLALPPAPLGEPASLGPTRPEVVVDVVGEAGEAGSALPRARRSTVVFRPLFATRERDAERREQQQRRQDYWQGEQRRRAALAPRRQGYPAAGYPAAYSHPAPGYPAAYGHGR